MIKSIQQFQTEGVKKLEKVFMDYSEDMTKFAEMAYGIRDGVLELAKNLIAEELEAYDEALRNSAKRKQAWQIVRRNELIKEKHFGWVYEGSTGNEALWKEMADYIEGRQEATGAVYRAVIRRKRRW